MRTIIALLFCAATVAFSQTKKIRGVVEDFDTRAPLPFATITLADSTFGTFANNEGEFLLTTGSLPTSITVSYIGHQSDTLRIDEEMLNAPIKILLKREEIVLPEVQVFATDSFAVAVIKQVYKNISDAAGNEVTGDGFYSQYTKVDSQYTEILQMFFRSLLNSQGIVDNDVQQGRYARLKISSHDSSGGPFWFTNFSFLTTNTFKLMEAKDSFFSFLPFVPKAFAYIPIRPDPEKYYYLKTEGLYSSNERRVAVIRCMARSGLDRPAFSGTVDVDLKDMQVIKVDWELPGWVGFFHYKSPTYEMTNFLWTYKAGFDRTFNNEYVMKFLNTTLSFDINSKHDPSNKKQWSFQSFLTFYRYESKVVSKPGASTKEKFDIGKIIRAGYDPAFWNYHKDFVSAIPTEQSIKESFIKHGFYGNLFPGGEPLNEK